MDLHWGPQGVLGGLLGPFFASLGPSVDPWVPPWGCPGPSWQHFPQFRCPKSRPRRIFHGFFNDFQEQILNFQYENSRFHTYLPIPYHNYFLSFQALQSLFPSTPPTIQASNPPMGPGGMRGAFRRPSVRRAGRAQRRNLPVLLRLFKLLSSSSSLHAFNFLLQSLSSIFCIVFGCLGRLFLPSIILPIGLRIPPGPSP